MKLFSLIACVVLFSPIAANAQNAPAQERRARVSAPITNQQGVLGQRPQAMPGTVFANQQIAPRIINSKEPVTVSASDTGEVVIYNGVRLGVPAGKTVHVSMEGSRIKLDAPSMEGISVGNAVYSTVDSSSSDPAAEASQAVPATLFVDPADGGVSIPRGGIPVFATVHTGEVIEINTYISLKGDVSGALSQEAPAAPVAAEPETPAETAPIEQAQPQQPATVVQTQPETVAQYDQQSLETTISDSSAASESSIVDEVEQAVEQTVAEETQGEQIKEEENLSPSTR